MLGYQSNVLHPSCVRQGITLSGLALCQIKLLHTMSSEQRRAPDVVLFNNKNADDLLSASSLHHTVIPVCKCSAAVSLVQEIVYGWYSQTCFFDCIHFSLLCIALHYSMD